MWVPGCAECERDQGFRVSLIPNECSLQVFAKADPRVAQFYETGLVPKELWGFGEDLRKKFHATKSVLLKARTSLAACQCSRAAQDRLEMPFPL